MSKLASTVYEPPSQAQPINCVECQQEFDKPPGFAVYLGPVKRGPQGMAGGLCLVCEHLPSNITCHKIVS